MIPIQENARKKMARELRIKGLTYKEIGRVLGISRQRAQQLVRPPGYVRRIVKKAAQGQCQDCGIPIEHGHIHHKKCDRTQNLDDFSDFTNLVYLCIGCHRRRHGSGIE